MPTFDTMTTIAQETEIDNETDRDQNQVMFISTGDIEHQAFIDMVIIVKEDRVQGSGTIPSAFIVVEREYILRNDPQVRAYISNLFAVDGNMSVCSNNRAQPNIHPNIPHSM